MLEKMGWTKGKGLGANLDGQLDFIKVSHKGDQKGVGFKDRDDQWTTHESNFNTLLNSFKSTENSDEEPQDFAVQSFQTEEKKPKKESGDDKDEHFSGVSLEEQSKNSRARVHYKKFTRGKDLSRYSEKDLANIFGKKSLKCNAEAGGSTSESNEDEKLDKSSGNTPNFGITTIETGTTINDYFKNKMKKVTNDPKIASDEHVECSVGIKKEKKSRKKSKLPEIVPNETVIGDNDPEIIEEIAADLPSGQTSNKESKKRKHENDNIEETKSNKKKKKKSIEQVVETIDCESEIKLVDEALKSKKSKKEIKSESSEIESVEATIKPRKSKTKKEVNTEKVEIVIDVDIIENHRSKKNRNKSGDGIKESESTEKNRTESMDVNDDDVKKARPQKRSKAEGENKVIQNGCNGPMLSSDQKPTNLFDFVANISDENIENLPEVVTDNVYEIRRYRTEIFRYVDLLAFPGSTLCDIPGYGYTSEMTLKIVDKGDDNKLINTLWNEAQDKYANGTVGKKKKKKFVEHIGDLKKKNIFKI